MLSTPTVNQTKHMNDLRQKAVNIVCMWENRVVCGQIEEKDEQRDVMDGCEERKKTECLAKSKK